MKHLITTFLLFVISTATLASPQTVTLLVQKMTCAACPITVKKSLSKVEGVSNIDISFEKREAVVTFDDAKTSIEQLMQATTNAGYPSTQVNTEK